MENVHVELFAVKASAVNVYCKVPVCQQFISLLEYALRVQEALMSVDKEKEGMVS
ncbi:hypothetical protein [Pseudescherichia sp.]|uniref:hypothetical protein n=1 Tax=Pseudescherichia sp. TaxID=2055881 RepID=UPI0028983BB4|nr:hypothetical protein [Pseudescherichia sp.]